MIPLAIGLGILGFMAMRRAHHRCHGQEYGWHGPWSGVRHHHRRHGRRRWLLHAALDRIDASPAQERAIIGNVEKLQERMHEAKSKLKDSRGDLAAALRGSVLDDAALGAVLGRTDAALGEVRSATLETLRSIHGVLDDKQRAQVADMLDRGGGWWRGGGPYR